MLQERGNSLKDRFFDETRGEKTDSTSRKISP